LNQLQNKLKDISYIIINEKSMISCQMLALIDLRFWQAFSEYNNEQFDRKSVIIFDDFG